jgi:hypothetical protein
MMSHARYSYAFLLISCGLPSVAAKADVLLSAEAPGIQASQVAGVTTETFDSIPLNSYTTLSSSVGTFTAPSPGLQVYAANMFGGAGGTGNFMVVGEEGTQANAAEADLSFGSPQSYLGLWLSALDSTNIIQLYSNNVLVASYNAPAVVAQLSNPLYKGNPTGPFLGQNPTEPYAYINFVGTNGTTFDQVRFIDHSTFAGLEIDNISLRTTPLSAPFPGTVISGGTTQGSAPEPGSLASLAVIGISLLFRRRLICTSGRARDRMHTCLTK